jgi:hypothetical protein
MQNKDSRPRYGLNKKAPFYTCERPVGDPAVDYNDRHAALREACEQVRPYLRLRYNEYLRVYPVKDAADRAPDIERQIDNASCAAAVPGLWKIRSELWKKVPGPARERAADLATRVSWSPSLDADRVDPQRPRLDASLGSIPETHGKPFVKFPAQRKTGR